MANMSPYRIKTISEFHELRGLPKPLHPLISIVNLKDVDYETSRRHGTWILDFYSISIKKARNLKYRYGQQDADFTEGVMFFMAPNQVFGIDPGADPSYRPVGWLLLIHPDFLWNTSLAKSIGKYEYFDYSVNEALFLSDKERETIKGIVENILNEYQSNIDKFSQDIVISQIETLLNYAQRFYNRQFITRKKSNHQVLMSLENILTEYFNSEDLLKNGLPTVQYISEKLNVSPGYLRNLLKVLTNQSTQQHIHEKLILKAKEKLSTTSMSVSEIAYALGFEHPQSFSKLFKTKTNLSPLEFRQSFN